MEIIDIVVAVLGFPVCAYVWFSVFFRSTNHDDSDSHHKKGG